MMSTPLYVDSKSSTQADVGQSSRVLMLLPEDPYEAIRQAYLDGTNTESEPFETPKSPHTVAPPTSLPGSTPPTLFLVLCRTACIAVCVPPAMSPGFFAIIAKVVAMSDLAPEEVDKIEESTDSDSVSEDAEDEGPTTKDEDLAAGDEGLTVGVEGPGIGVESCGSDDKVHGLDDEGHSIESDGLGLEEEDEAIPGGQQQEALVVGTTVSAPLGLGQGFGSAPEPERPEIVSALRQPTLTTWMGPKDGIVYIDILAYLPPTPPVQAPPSLEWLSGSFPISPAPSIVPSPISSPMIPLTVPSPVVSPATIEAEGLLTELRAQVEMQGGLIHDHMGQSGMRSSPKDIDLGV
nr:hypothetical protein [Tanacetum cinerariifolium]